MRVYQVESHEMLFNATVLGVMVTGPGFDICHCPTDRVMASWLFLPIVEVTS
jgi:hypothetical protein